MDPFGAPNVHEPFGHVANDGADAHHDHLVAAQHQRTRYELVDYRFAAPDNELASSALVSLLAIQPSSFGQEETKGTILPIPTKAQLAVPTRTRMAYHELRKPILVSETFYGMRSEFLESPIYSQPVCYSGDQCVSCIKGKHELTSLPCTFAVAEDEVNELCAIRSNSLVLLHLPTDHYPLPDAPRLAELKLGLKENNSRCILGYVSSIQKSPGHVVRGNREPMWSSLDGTGPPQLGKRLMRLSATVVIIKSTESEAVLEKFRRAYSAAPIRLEMTFLGKLQQFFRNLRMICLPEPVDGNADANASPLLDLVINPELVGGENFQFIELCNWPHELIFERLFEQKKPTITCVTGGPGTGKTFNVVRRARDILFAQRATRRNPPMRILFFAPSNEAANVVYRQFAKLGLTHQDHPNHRLRVLRVGEESKFTRHIRDEMDQKWKEHIRALRDRPNVARTDYEVKQDFYCRADVIISTCGSAQSPVFTDHRNAMPFNVVVIDEAGQAHETELLLPLHLPKLRHLILVGDPAQLGPTIFTPALQSYPMSAVSPFSRLVKALPRRCHWHIIQQRRMRPLVAHLVSVISYRGPDQMENVNWNQLREILHQRVLQLPPFLVFSGEDWQELKDSITCSVDNTNEAIFAVRLLCASFKQMGYDIENGREDPDPQHPVRIGLLALYQNQVTELNRQVEMSIPPPLMRFVSVGTVDSMQGNSFDLVIVSAVRASVDRTVGFTVIQNRINVALSRGATLFVLAYYPTFGLAPGWSSVFQRGIRWNLVEFQANRFSMETLCEFLEAKKAAYLANPICQERARY